MSAKKVYYSKKALTISQQIQQLESRGMIIKDKILASNVLGSINYYRLSGYWMYYEISREPHKFAENTSFENVFDMYNFDKNLRFLIFEGISRFEVSLRTYWAYETGLKYGPQCYYYKKYNKNLDFLKENIKKSKKEVSRSKEIFVKHHTTKYTGQLPAVWVFCEVISLGSLSCWYTNLKEVPSSNEKNSGNAKDSIAKYYNIDSKLLESWLHSITVLRNLCAHQSRIVNKVFSINPIKPKSKKLKIRTYWEENNLKAYNMLLLLVYLNSQIKAPSDWIIKFKEFLLTNKENCINYLGFPKNWYNLDFWKV